MLFKRVFPKIVVPQKHPKMIKFSRKANGCWVPPFMETPKHLWGHHFPFKETSLFRAPADEHPGYNLITMRWTLHVPVAPWRFSL